MPGMQGGGLVARSGPREEAAGLIAGLAAAALRAEVDATPKPGLVDRANSGAHRDMDHALFVRSIGALTPFFRRFAAEALPGGRDQEARVGRDCPGRPDPDPGPDPLVGRLRAVGLQAERAMLRATGGINTHQGLIFSLGLLAASAGRLWGRYEILHGPGCGRRTPLRAETVCAAAARLARGIVRRDLGGGEDGLQPTACCGVSGGPDTGFGRTGALPTRGEQLYRRYGLTGARGEAESGFRTVRVCGLPLLRRLRAMCPGEPERVHVAVLLSLMTAAADTNVVARHGPAALDLVRAEATRALRLGGPFTAAGMRVIEGLDRRFIALGISPGGAADLLAVSIFLQRLENDRDVDILRAVW
jgi:triphosphoribosyl-dephospho-CoA synthase